MVSADPSIRVIDFVKSGILAGKLQVNDRLPAERKLAQQLNISRASVREGVRLLEIIGIVECRRGSGNYIVRHSDDFLKRVLTMVYTLDNPRYEEILEFRHTIELIALALAIRQAKPQEKKALRGYLSGLLRAKTQKERVKREQNLHLTLVRMSGNHLLISNYAALNRVIDRSNWKTHQMIPDHMRSV